MARPNAVLLGRWRDMILSKHGPRDAGARLVAIAVAKFINIAALSTYVSADTLAESTGLNERSVRKHLDGLLAGGWLIARARHQTRGWKLREFTPKFPAGVPEDFSGTHMPATDAAENSSGTQSATAGAPEEISRVPEDSSPWSGRNFPMDRKKRPTNSGSHEHEEEPGSGPGRSDLKNLTSRKSSGERLSEAQLEERRQQQLASIERELQRRAAERGGGATNDSGSQSITGQGSEAIGAGTGTSTRATQAVA